MASSPLLGCVNGRNLFVTVFASKGCCVYTILDVYKNTELSKHNENYVTGSAVVKPTSQVSQFKKKLSNNGPCKQRKL